jgi:hypothetical protein
VSSALDRQVRKRVRGGQKRPRLNAPSIGLLTSSASRSRRKSHKLDHGSARPTNSGDHGLAHNFPTRPGVNTRLEPAEGPGLDVRRHKRTLPIAEKLVSTGAAGANQTRVAASTKAVTTAWTSASSLQAWSSKTECDDPRLAGTCSSCHAGITATSVTDQLCVESYPYTSPPCTHMPRQGQHRYHWSGFSTLVDRTTTTWPDPRCPGFPFVAGPAICPRLPLR